MEQEARDKAVEIARQKKLEAQVKDREDQIAAMEMQNQLIGADQEKALEIAQANLDKKIAQESDAHTKLQLLNAKAAMQNQQNLIKQKEYEDKIQAEKLKGYSTFFGGVASLQNAHNKTLAAAGKAAAISQATIDAYLAIQNALAHIPAPANIAAAAGIGVQAFANVARISGVQLAEGGVVMPSPGGTQATIGEGGQPEMVLPLDKAQSAGFGGGGTTVIFNGPIMGNEAQAEEFARAIDRQLLKLRQSNQSVAFETDVI